jgi:hypothetical protein
MTKENMENNSDPILDDLVERLVLTKTEHELCWEAADEITNLRIQLNLAHKILSDESMVNVFIELDEHIEKHVENLRSMISLYYNMYGNVYYKKGK